MKPMNVGRIVRVFKDNSRRDPFTDKETRSVVVSIYYPLFSTQTSDYEPFYIHLFEPSAENALNILEAMGVDKQYFKTIKTNVYNNAVETFSYNSHPIILYTPAFGVVCDMYLYNIQKLVECGFIVVAIGAMHESIFTIFPDGQFFKQLKVISSIESADFFAWNELLETRVSDIRFVLDNLEYLNNNDMILRGAFDIRRVGIVGHSLGGAAAFVVANRDKRIQAGVMLDASFHLLSIDERNRLETPFLIMRQGRTTYEELKDVLPETIMTPFVKGYERIHTSLSGYKSFTRLLGGHHMTFSDVPLHYNEKEIATNHAIINKYVSAFLEEFIQNKHLAYQTLITNKALDGINEIDHKGHVI